MSLGAQFLAFLKRFVRNHPTSLTGQMNTLWLWQFLLLFQIGEHSAHRRS
jgi:hypothetical protein